MEMDSDAHYMGNDTKMTSALRVWCVYTSLGYEKSRIFKINLLTVAVMNSIFAVSAIILNALVLTAFLRNRNILKGSNIILFGLCIADFVSGVIVQVPISVVLFMVFVHGNEGMNCILLTFASISGYIFVGISLLTVSFVSLERFISIFYPYVYERVFTKNTMVFGSVLIWSAMIVLNLYCFFAQERMAFYVVQSAVISLTYVWTIIVYFKILKQVRKITKAEAELTRRFQKKEAERELKANRIVRFVILSLLTCYSLQVVVAMFQSLGGNIRVIDNYVYFWSFTFGIVNCSLNPLIYCYCNSEIRKKVYELIRFAKRGIETSSETFRPTHNQGPVGNN